MVVAAARPRPSGISAFSHRLACIGLIIGWRAHARLAVVYVMSWRMPRRAAILRLRALSTAARAAASCCSLQSISAFRQWWPQADQQTRTMVAGSQAS